MQVGLGISTLLLYVPVPVAAAHQEYNCNIYHQKYKKIKSHEKAMNLNDRISSITSATASLVFEN